jgi:hypothetical protein
MPIEQERRLYDLPDPDDEYNFIEEEVEDGVPVFRDEKGDDIGFPMTDIRYLKGLLKEKTGTDKIRSMNIKYKEDTNELLIVINGKFYVISEPTTMEYGDRYEGLAVTSRSERDRMDLLQMIIHEDPPRDTYWVPLRNFSKKAKARSLSDTWIVPARQIREHEGIEVYARAAYGEERGPQDLNANQLRDIVYEKDSEAYSVNYLSRELTGFLLRKSEKALRLVYTEIRKKILFSVSELLIQNIKNEVENIASALIQKKYIVPYNLGIFGVYILALMYWFLSLPRGEDINVRILVSEKDLIPDFMFRLRNRKKSRAAPVEFLNKWMKIPTLNQFYSILEKRVINRHDKNMKAIDNWDSFSLIIMTMLKFTDLVRTKIIATKSETIVHKLLRKNKEFRKATEYIVRQVNQQHRRDMSIASIHKVVEKNMIDLAYNQFFPIMALEARELFQKTMPVLWAESDIEMVRLKDKIRIEDDPRTRKDLQEEYEDLKTDLMHQVVF